MLLLITSYTFLEGQFKAPKLTTVCDTSNINHALQNPSQPPTTFKNKNIDIGTDFRQETNHIYFQKKTYMMAKTLPIFPYFKMQ